MNVFHRKGRNSKIRTICLVSLFLAASFLLGLIAGTTIGKISEQIFTRHFSENSSELVLSSFDEALDEKPVDAYTATGILYRLKRSINIFWLWLKQLTTQPLQKDNSLQDNTSSATKHDLLPRYSTHSAQDTRGERNLAYFIQVSSSTVQRLDKLLGALYHPDNVYAIHLDKKIPELLRRQVMRRITSNDSYRDNVYFMESEPVTYRGISMVLNTIEAMNFLLTKDSKWDYFINLSGSDYPLVSATFIRKLFGLVPSNQLNFIQLYPEIEWSDEATRFRIETVHFDPALEFNDDLVQSESLISFGVQHPFRQKRNFTYVKSDFWSIFSREFSEFIVRDTFAKKMLAVFAVSDTSDEAYFATCAYNHPHFHSTIVPEAFRAVYFCHKDMNPACNGQHPFTMDEQGNEEIFWNTLLYSKAIFARKFSKKESHLMHRLDELRNGGLSKAQDNLTKSYQISVQCRLTNAIVPILESFLQQIPNDNSWRRLNTSLESCQQWKKSNEILRKKEDSFVSISNFFDSLGVFYF
ncbi:Beta-glucuronosyltransferase GlcAT14B [Galdieria sulphuraria]|nr:Beta-glucuronosyltransferase GlcAT14B [Galdieria sulphuraria]